MKYPATLSTALVLLALAPASIDASDGDAGSLLRSRTRQGNKNVFSNTISYSSEEPVVGKLLSPFVTSIVKNFNSCKDDWEDSGEEFVYCDIYFNPHTAYSYYRNPSAIGVLRGQLCYNGTTSTDGYTHFFSVPEATSEIMDNLMSETGLQELGGADGDCINATYTKLGPGVASAVAEVSWNEDTDVITLLSSTITLKDMKTKDIRCKWCTGDFDTIDGAGLTCTEGDSDEDSKEEKFNNKESYSNLIIIGSHLHRGNAMTDGPPPVFFCREDILTPPDSVFVDSNTPGSCSSGGSPLYTED